ncbi:nicotinate-nucleotide adenylyltransferase [Edaphobacter albus]|uniref:nicotinate-nucleotide adenylyltransferase n=1 Tax=Edaphobacter sp. 4G125 TaxID=2763071 RepID=UPI0016479FD8|nr:nicotinate-nucleotide adenylyltransferase [Edaphobacter sp. 4G125]QNI37058.1 nicotinate (nicotinamide) nucleotide adenylyltransferase [Edaphobacter sp. 4G125]
MRVALFGGTFDPPHLGHLAIAKAAADAFQLDSVLFAPAGLQPLKTDHHTSPFKDRLEMVRLACKIDHRFHASLSDAPQPDGTPNYTVETLATLRQQMPHATLFNLVGADSFLTLRQWREPDRLLTLADWIVVSRPGSSLDDLSSLHLTPEQHSHVHLLTTVHEDISATQLRQYLAVGDPCRNLLPPEVEQYIRQHGLYQGSQ